MFKQFGDGSRGIPSRALQAILALGLAYTTVTGCSPRSQDQGDGQGGLVPQAPSPPGFSCRPAWDVWNVGLDGEPIFPKGQFCPFEIPYFEAEPLNEQTPISFTSVDGTNHTITTIGEPIGDGVPMTSERYLSLLNETLNRVIGMLDDLGITYPEGFREKIYDSLVNRDVSLTVYNVSDAQNYPVLPSCYAKAPNQKAAKEILLTALRNKDFAYIYSLAHMQYEPEFGMSDYTARSILFNSPSFFALIALNNPSQVLEVSHLFPLTFDQFENSNLVNELASLVETEMSHTSPDVWEALFQELHTQHPELSQDSLEELFSTILYMQYIESIFQQD